MRHIPKEGTMACHVSQTPAPRLVGWRYPGDTLCRAWRSFDDMLMHNGTSCRDCARLPQSLGGTHVED